METGAVSPVDDDLTLLRANWSFNSAPTPTSRSATATGLSRIFSGSGPQQTGLGW